MRQRPQCSTLLLGRLNRRFARHAPPPRITAKTESHPRFVGQADRICLGFGWPWGQSGGRPAPVGHAGGSS
jgi:hypothetical protein